MKLLKELSSKSWITSGNKKTSARFALFECPYCGTSVELPRAKGIKQKSCGSTDCKRQANIDGYNRELSANNNGNTKDNRTTKPYYTTIKEIYRLNTNSLEQIGILSFDEFYNVSYDKYVKARETGSKIKTIINNNGISFQSSLNEMVEKTKKNIDYNNLIKIAQDRFDKKIKTLEQKINEYSIRKENDIDRILNTYKYSTILLSNETLINHTTIINKIKKLSQKQVSIFKDFSFNTISIDARQHIYELSKQQYELLKSILSDNIKNISTHIYIIKSIAHNEYKIGIANDVNKRFNSILSMSPLGSRLELIYFKNIGPVASKLEVNIHKKLKNKNMHSHFEWFNLDDNTVNTIINTIENYNTFLNKINNEERELKIKKEEKRIQQLIKKEEEKFKKEIFRINELQQFKKKDVQENINKSNDHIISIEEIKKEKEIIRKEQTVKKETEKKQLAELTKRTDYTQSIKHGMTNTKAYHSWQSMKQRAKDENVDMEPEWVESFDNWFSDIGNQIRDGFNIVRIDSSKGFTKDNIKIVSILEARQKVHAKPVVRIDIDTGSEITYPSAKEAANNTPKATPGHITATCQGKRKKHAGYQWRYAA